MGGFSKKLSKAADDAERMARALQDSMSNVGGGGASGGASSIEITNNITTGMGSGVVNRDLQSRAFAYFGMSSAGKSDVYIAQIIREFERMLAKSAIGFRTMGLS